MLIYWYPTYIHTSRHLDIKPLRVYLGFFSIHQRPGKLSVFHLGKKTFKNFVVGMPQIPSLLFRFKNSDLITHIYSVYATKVTQLKAMEMDKIIEGRKLKYTFGAIIQS